MHLIRLFFFLVGTSGFFSESLRLPWRLLSKPFFTRQQWCFSESLKCECRDSCSVCWGNLLFMRRSLRIWRSGCSVFLFLSLLPYVISQGGLGDFSISFRYNRFDCFFQLGTSGIFYDSMRCVRRAYRCDRCENLFLPGNSDVFLNPCAAPTAWTILMLSEIKKNRENWPPD
jgi:hypothetical protein